MTSLRGRLAEAVLYLCTDARERQGDTEGFLDRALGGGVDIVQLRHKGLEAGAELRYLETFRRACDKHGALLAVNDRADVAYAAGADVLHLGQDDLPAAVARQICGPDIVIGLSSHDEQQAAAAAARPEADYYCTGPVWPTPTKPGRPAPGLPLVRFAAGLGLAAENFADASKQRTQGLSVALGDPGSYPVDFRRSSLGTTSRRRLRALLPWPPPRDFSPLTQSQDLSAHSIGQDIEGPVRPLAHTADPRVLVGEQTFFAADAVAIEDETHEVLGRERRHEQVAVPSRKHLARVERHA
jgi:thiamine-phosphate pyrophosphorylase